MKKENLKFEDYTYMVDSERNYLYRSHKKTFQRLDYVDGKRAWVKDKFDKPLVFINYKHLGSILSSMGINISEIYYID